MEDLAKFSSISLPTSTASIDLIPIDIWIKITSTFSIKSLIFLSCVNKFFLAIITDPAFISAHLRRPNSGTQLLTYEGWSHGVVFAIRDAGSRFIGRVIKPGLKEIEPNKVHWDEVVCSLDGLLVLSRPHTNMTATLWNPSMRQHRLLELPKADTEHYFGIGYRLDPLNNNDYKIVALHASQDKAWLYTVGTKSWTPITNRRFVDHDNNTYTYSMGMSIKHTTVWIESVNNLSSPPSKRLLLFHFETETFCYASLPLPDNRDVSHQGLTLLDGGSTVGMWWVDKEVEISVWSLDTNTMDWAARYKLLLLQTIYTEVYLENIAMFVVCSKEKRADRSMIVEKGGRLNWRYWNENGYLNSLTFSFNMKRKIYCTVSGHSAVLCLDVYHESLVMIN